jgi:hypothetical protein
MQSGFGNQRIDVGQGFKALEVLIKPKNRIQHREHGEKHRENREIA